MEPRVLQFDDRGAGDPLVLVPGGLAGWVSWVPHQERLVDRHRVVRVQPIHNELGSKGVPGDSDYTAQIERESLRLTLDALDLERPHFAGWSGVASPWIEFAIEYPERVRSLTLVEPAAYWVLALLGERLDEVERRTASSTGCSGERSAKTSWRPSSDSAASPNPARTCLTPQLESVGRAPGHVVVAEPAPGSPGALDR